MRIAGRAASLTMAAALLVGCSSNADTSKPEPTNSASPSSSAAPTTQSSSGSAVRYLALGDSVTSGEGVSAEETYPSRLAQMWRATGCTVKLNNVAVSGYKAEDVIVDQLPAVTTFRPTLVTLMVGANDIANGVPVEQYRTNVRTILQALKAAGVDIVTISQQFWERTPFGQEYGTQSELAAMRTEFNDALIAEGDAVGAQYVDLAAVFEEQAEKKMWLEDGLHPTAEAYEGWAAELFAKIANPCGGS